MTASLVSDGEAKVRTGSRTLEMLASSISSQILRALSGGSRELADLGEELGAPIQIPGREAEGVEARITPSGREMLFVSVILERWLRKAPRGDLPFGGDGATEAVEALAGSWSSVMLHALAERPRSHDELERLVDPAAGAPLERCLEAMRLTGQVEARPGRGGAAYSVTDWLREAVAPLAAAARLERRHFAEDTPPVAPLDVEAAFLLAVPLLRLSADHHGSARLAVEMDDGERLRHAGVMVHVEEGRVVSCTTCLEGDEDASAIGDLGAWFGAVIEADYEGIECGGEEILAKALLEGLHEALFVSGD